MKKQIMSLSLFLLIFIFSACGATESAQSDVSGSIAHSVAVNAHGHGISPTDEFIDASNPKFAVGSKVIILADHMEGMAGAQGVVSGAYDTTVYAIDYEDKETGEKITNHKWIIHEEIEGAAQTAYAVGDTVTLKAGHISTMGGEGVTATISEVVPGVAYMVDYQPTDGSEAVEKHQWVVESELEAVAS
ncbi:MAG: DUF1541 domain-containing protein [Oscillospiraceae bacterium]